MLLEAFYQRNKDKLTSVLTRYSRDSEEAKDAVQQAFLKALQQRETLSSMDEKACWSWLYATAKNALTDAKRKSARYDLRGRLGADEPEASGYSGYGVSTAASAEETVMVKELLYKLPPHLIHIVALRYWGGLNATEIGKLKGIPPATVRTRLRTALGLLKKQLVLFGNYI